MTQFFPLTITKAHRETRDSLVLTLRPRDEDAPHFNFTQGQYLTLRATIDGEDVRRSYSICAGRGETLRIGVKIAVDGLFSGWLNAHAKPGLVVEAMAPSGKFFTNLDAANRKHYLGFAAGSGITPLLSIVKTTLAQEPHSRFTLVYGNRASSTIMFRDELDDIKAEHLQRFSIFHILSRERQDVDLFNGRIGAEKCDQLFKSWLRISDINTAFICGPQDMMRQVSESLQSHGLDRKQIRFELFGASSRGRKAETLRPAAGAHAELCHVTLTIDGRTQEFNFAKGTSSLLNAGLAAGLELPFACKAGVCSTCKTTLVQGEVDMDANFSLEDYEIARGAILMCQSFPVTPKIVVDYDC